MTIGINPRETQEIFTWGVETFTTEADSKLNKNMVIFPSRLFR